VTRPDVIISGGDDLRPPRTLPRWLLRGAATVLVLGALVSLGLRVASDERRRHVALQAADEVDAVVRISEAAIGAGGTVVVGVQVLGQGRELRVDRPRVRPAPQRLDVVGAPITIAADRGNQIRLRLLPRCASALTLARLDIELPITPASGRQHRLRVPFPNGPALVRRACGYLPVDEAVTLTTSWAAVTGRLLHVSFALRNDGREPLVVSAVQGTGIEAVGPRLPLPLPPGGPPVELPLVLRVTDCTVRRADPRTDRSLSVLVAGEVSGVREIMPSLEPIAAEYLAWGRAACP
jgi:hypothetical protein